MLCKESEEQRKQDEEGGFGERMTTRKRDPSMIAFCSENMEAQCVAP